MIDTPRIFVIDADLSARGGLSRLLKTASYEVLEFDRVAEFLESLETETDGCVVLDVIASADQDEDLRADLDARGIRLPIIVISTIDDSQTRSCARKTKAVAFFRKPVDSAALLDTIRWALNP
jgi:FixJ family two-component response regulator